jgi:hypothetical protein
VAGQPEPDPQKKKKKKPQIKSSIFECFPCLNGSFFRAMVGFSEKGTQDVYNINVAFLTRQAFFCLKIPQAMV